MGEAPGAQEVAQGKPFVGPAGLHCLDIALRAAGIDRSKCYLTNVMQVRPPGNKFAWFAKNCPGDLAAGQARLRAELSAGNFSAVVALGNEPLEALCYTRNITDWQCSVVEVEGIGPVIPALHPSGILHSDMTDFPLLVMALKRAKLVAEEQPTLPKEPERIIVTSAHDCVALVRHCERIAFDLETGPNSIRLVGFCGDPSQVAILRVDDTTYFEPLREIFNHPKHKMIAQNAVFDLGWLSRVGLEGLPLHLDTMLGQHVLAPELPKSLNFLRMSYTLRPYYDHLSKTDNPRYNALDCVTTLECADYIEQGLEDRGLWDFYLKVPHALIQPVLDMMSLGFRVNRETIKLARRQLEHQLESYESKCIEAFGHVVNPNPSKSLMSFLFDELGLKVGKLTVTGRPKVDDDSLDTLAKKSKLKCVAFVRDARKAKKMLSRHLSAGVDYDGRMRCSYNIGGTETGRLSSSRSLYGSGTNLQNVEHGVVRSTFIPSKGCLLVAADLSQAEARVVAALAKDPVMLQFFAENKDIHTMVASMIFDKDPEKITPNERKAAKRIVHAANYMMGPLLAARLLEIQQYQAADLLRRYFYRFPNIERWQDNVRTTLAKTRTLKTPWGRTRFFYGRLNRATQREAVAWVPQSTIADTLNIGWISLYHDAGFRRCVAQLHDALIADVKVEHVGIVARLMKSHLTVPIPFPGGDIIVPVDVTIGANWNDMVPFEGTTPEDWKRYASYVE